MKTMPEGILARLRDLPVRRVEAGEVLVHAGGDTQELMFLKEGALDVEIEDAHLARVTEPGAVIGDISFLLHRPHTATVRAAARSELFVAEDPAALLRGEPDVMLYIAAVLAGRLNAVNHLLIETRRRAEEREEPGGLLAETLSRVGQALNIRGPR
jgi:CRP/FNR family cyclic AMP-dependent transcriptional regulator